MGPEGNTNMTKLIVAFPNSATAYKTGIAKYSTKYVYIICLHLMSTSYVYTAKLIAET